tara:strand:- start:38 stop:142 length:105 start_codon:yes stop_codon:yes gene_type:complete
MTKNSFDYVENYTYLEINSKDKDKKTAKIKLNKK